MTHAAAARDPRIELISSGWVARHGAAETPSSYFRARQARGSHYFGVADYIGRHGRPIFTGVLRARTDLLKRVGGFDSRWAHGADVRCWLDLLINLRGKAFWVAAVTSIYHTDAVNMVSHGRRQRVSPTTELVRRYVAENAPQIRPFRSKLIRYANHRAMLPFLHALKPGDLAPRNLARTFIFSVRDPLLPLRLLLCGAYRRFRRGRK